MVDLEKISLEKLGALLQACYVCRVSGATPEDCENCETGKISRIGRKKEGLK